MSLSPGLTRPLTLPLSGNIFGGASDPNLPPSAQSALVLAFDPSFGAAGQVHTSRVGPAGQLGSTSGVDTNDPTYEPTAPARYLFGSDDYVTFGDVLNSVLSGASCKFSVMAAFELGAGDVGAYRMVTQKWVLTDSQFQLRLSNGKPHMLVFLNSNTGNIDGQEATGSAVAAGRHTIAACYDATIARVSGRGMRLWLDGAPPAQFFTGSGSDGTVAATPADLRFGKDSFVPPQSIAWFFVYNRPLTDAEVSANHAWIVARGWS